ncbi:MAG: hemerythrin domain-containing protein [Archangium sp.]|nr:hemerythrin domain-containing protein [Archangium sp.]
MKKRVSMNLVQLGLPDGVARGDPPETLLGLLLACHTRIRRFARLALTVGARPELPAAEVKDAASQCLRYFTEALPLHVRDEEDSLWPRLAGHSAALDATMAQMRAQHFAHRVRLDALTSALEAVRQRPNEPGLHKELAAAASTLETDFEDHLALEEAELFPFFDEALDAEAQEAIVRELRARRSPPS